jgi:hypothetical protein
MRTREYDHAPPSDSSASSPNLLHFKGEKTALFNNRYNEASSFVHTYPLIVETPSG